MIQFATTRELILALYTAIDELAALAPERAKELQAQLESKPPTQLRVEDYLAVRSELDLRRTPSDDAPRESVIERDFGIFLDAIPRGRQLLADVEVLADATSFEELVRQAKRVFVDDLGYSAAYLDESGRTERAEFDRIVRIGRFGEVEVVCVSLARINWFAQFYDVIYRFHPYAVILSMEPNARSVRVVYRDGPTRTPHYRVLAGPTTDWEPNDNLLVWAWRLHQLRPQLGETPQTLQRRTARALRLAPEAVATDWPSVEIREPVEDLPGVPWQDAAARAFSSFVQSDCEPAARRRWGLEAVLRDRFPIAVGGAMGPSLHCVGWSLGPPPPSVAYCTRLGIDRVREVILQLELRDESSSAFEFRGELPEPDTSGRFVFEGRPYQFTALVGDDGRLAVLEEPEEDREEEAEAEVEEALEGSEAESSAAEQEPEAKARAVRGMSPRAMYEYAVSRKLAQLAYRLFRVTLDSANPASSLIAEALRVGRRYDRFPLAAWTVLRRFIAPAGADVALRMPEGSISSLPPSWACVEHSAALPQGCVTPVAGARIHPTGSLCVPLSTARGVRLELSTAPATEINPRCISDQRTASHPTQWWISPRLAQFAHLPPGSLSDVEAAASSRPLQARVAITRGERRTAVVASDLAWVAPLRWTVEARVPATGDRAPSVLVTQGSRVQRGTPWLQCSEATWRMSSWRPSPWRCLAAELLGERDPDARRALLRDPRRVWRIPADVGGIVERADCTPVRGPSGVVLAWVARVEVVRRGVPDVVLGPDGASYPVVERRERYDMPFDGDGAVDVLLTHPSAVVDSNLVDARSGEPLAVGHPLGPWRASARPESRPSLDLRRRSSDGEEIPDHVRCTISERDRLRWLLAADDGAPAPPSGWTRTFQAAAEAAALGPRVAQPPRGELPDPTRTRMSRPLKRPEHGAAFPLPTPVVHPFRKPAAAALLGLTTGELGVLARRHGVRAVVDVIRHVASQATDRGTSEAAERRLATETQRSVRTELGDGLRLLRRLRPHDLPDLLVLDALPIPIPELTPFGFEPGSERALRTPLLAAYRNVTLVTQAAEQIGKGGRLLDRYVEVQLQAAVDALFGGPDSPADGRTLAGWLARTLPLTRSSTARVTHARLVWHRTERGLVPSFTNTEGAVTTDLPALESEPSPGSREWWMKRAARSWLAHDHLPWFVGLFAECEGALADDLPVASGLRGRWLAREWLRRLSHPSSNPVSLAEVLSSRLPLFLPSDIEEARGSVVPVLEQALPGSDEAGELLRGVLARVLLGFWVVPASTDHPEGWRWSQLATPPPVGGRRALPPIGSPAWRLWPSIGQATSAIRYALTTVDGGEIAPLLRYAIGVGEDTWLPAPSAIHSEGHERLPSPPIEVPEQRVATTTISVNVESVSAPEPKDDDIRVANIGLRQWLELTRSELERQ